MEILLHLNHRRATVQQQREVFEVDYLFKMCVCVCVCVCVIIAPTVRHGQWLETVPEPNRPIFHSSLCSFFVFFLCIKENSRASLSNTIAISHMWLLSP